MPEFYESDFTNSYEVGWKSTLADGRLVVNGAAYHIAWDNFQTVLYDLLTVPFNFRRNVEGATVTGVEVDMIARLNENWFVTGGLARNNAELVGDFATIAREPRFVYAEQGRRLAHTPEWSAALGLRYDQTLANGTNVYGQFNWSFTDERWNLLARQSEQPPVVMDAYSLVHLRAGRRLPGRRVGPGSLCDQRHGRTGPDLPELGLLRLADHDQPAAHHRLAVEDSLAVAGLIAGGVATCLSR